MADSSFSSLAALPALQDLVGGLFGADRFSQLFGQNESDFKQYGDAVTDRRLWSGVKDKSSPEYFFLLKNDTATLQIPFNVNPQREIIQHPHAMSIAYAQGGGKVVQSEGMTTKDITIQGSCGLYAGNRKPTAPASGIGSGLEQIKFLEALFQRYCFLKRFGDAGKTLQLIYINRRLQDAWIVEPKSFTREDAAEHNFNFSYTIVLETIAPYRGADAKGLAQQLLDNDVFNTFDAVAQRASEAVDNLNAVIGEISAVVDGFANLVMSDVTALAQAYADIKSGKFPNKTSFKRDATKSLIANLVATANALEAAGVNPKTINKVIRAEKVCIASLLQDVLYTPSATSSAKSVAATQKAQSLNLTNADGSAVSPSEASAIGAATKKPSQQQLLAGGVTKATATAITQGGSTKTVVGSTSTGSAALQKASQSAGAIDALAKTNPTLAASLKAALEAQNKAKSTTTVGNAVQNQGSSLAVSSPTSDGPTTTLPGDKPVALSGSLNKYGIVPPGFEQQQSQAAWAATLEADLAAIDPARATYKTGRVASDDDIQTLAFKLLGDHAKWPQLVMLNGLRYPYVASAAYIAANGLTNVIAWGQPIVYAAPKTVGGTPTRVWRNETDVSRSLQPFERALGNDIRINAATGNIVWGADDVELVYGVENIAQFIRKRVSIKKGRWRRAISVGFTDFLGFSDGVQADVIRAEGQGLFVDDARIVSTNVGQVTQTAGVLINAMQVRVRDVEDPIVVPVS